MFRGEGASKGRFVCQQNVSIYVQTTLFGTVLQEKVSTIYDHPTTQYEQFIEQYYGRHKGSGKSKATVISNGQVILLDIRCDDMGGGSNLTSQ